MENTSITTITNFDDIEFFSFNGMTFECRVIKVYDGDSITGIINFAGKYYKLHIRLDGIDACELREKNKQLKIRAIVARNRLVELLDFKEENIPCIVNIHCKQMDKFGRVLADIYNSDDVLVQDILVSEKHAYKYSGGTKMNTEEQIKYFSD